MRILWLAHRDILDPRRGGAERTIVELSTRLASRGHEVHVVLPRFGDSPRDELVHGVKLHRAPTPIGPHLRSLSLYASSGKETVVVNDLGHVLPWLTPYCSTSPGVAFFRHLHQRTLSGQTNRFAAAALKWVERRYHLLYGRWTIVTESSSSVRDLGFLGFNPSQCVEIPPGVDTRAFTVGPKSETPSIIYFGGFRSYKRPLDALRACAGLKDRGLSFRLYLVGRGSTSRPVADELARLGLASSTQALGKIDETSLATLIRSCHVNVHCAVAEGWCYSALEASASGVPTVAYRVPGISDCVVDKETGLLVPDGNVEDLTNGLETVLRSPESWIQPCRSRAEKFTWDRCADRWEDCLRSAARF
jgi:glycosyltransferase involved in cell wall biosynthesis